MTQFLGSYTTPSAGIGLNVFEYEYEYMQMYSNTNTNTFAYFSNVFEYEYEYFQKYSNTNTNTFQSIRIHIRILYQSSLKKQRRNALRHEHINCETSIHIYISNQYCIEITVILNCIYTLFTDQ